MKINVSKEDAPVVSLNYIQKGHVYKHTHTGSTYYLAIGRSSKAEGLVNLNNGYHLPINSISFDGWVEVEAEVVIK